MEKSALARIFSTNLCESTDQQVLAHIPPFSQRIVLRINRSTGFCSHIGGKIGPCKDIFNESLRINRSTSFCTYTPILANNCVANQQTNRFLVHIGGKIGPCKDIFNKFSANQQINRFLHIYPHSRKELCCESTDQQDSGAI